jgi:hypothetical protein
MTGFCIQEFIISGLYLWKTVRLLQIVSKQGTKRVIWQLFTINVIIIAMDIALLVLEYRNLRVLEQAFKVVIYSIKLKLEFAILGKLVELVQQNGRSLSNAMLDIDTKVDQTKGRTSGDLTMFGSQGRSTDSGSSPHWPDYPKKDHHQQCGVQHVETIEDVYGNETHKGRMMSVEIESQDLPRSSNGPNRGSKASEPDLTYAEVMRSLSQ